MTLPYLLEEENNGSSYHQPKTGRRKKGTEKQLAGRCFTFSYAGIDSELYYTICPGT